MGLTSRASRFLPLPPRHAPLCVLLLVALVQWRCPTATATYSAGCDPATAPLKPAGKNSIFRFASVNYDVETRKWGLATSANWTADESLYSLRRVRDQGSCGSSWAMAAVTAVELAYAVVRNASNDMAAPRYLSTQQVLNCVSSKTGNCTGGWPTTAMDYVVKATDKYGGMVTEGNYPYKGNRTTSYGTKDDDDDDDDSDDKKKSKCDTSKVKKKATKIGIRSYESIDYYGWLGLILAVAGAPRHRPRELGARLLPQLRIRRVLGLSVRGGAGGPRRGGGGVHLLVARAPLDPQKFLGGLLGHEWLHASGHAGRAGGVQHPLSAGASARHKDRKQSPCSLLVNPCGSGVCIPAAAPSTSASALGLCGRQELGWHPVVHASGLCTRARHQPVWLRHVSQRRQGRPRVPLPTRLRPRHHGCWISDLCALGQDNKEHQGAGDSACQGGVRPLRHSQGPVLRPEPRPGLERQQDKEGQEGGREGHVRHGQLRPLLPLELGQSMLGGGSALRHHRQPAEGAQSRAHLPRWRVPGAADLCAGGQWAGHPRARSTT
ncbi:hypothetical protein CLOM_g19163 [Closterium sp. NIES-68]|nr:hypothetical protein CLOM_g19163 [Closterium sp. NIES-68]